MNITTVIPESMRAAGNNLAAVIGLSMADRLTFDLAPRVQDAEGNQYRWVCAQCSDGWLAGLGTPLVRPDYDTDSALDVPAAQALLAGALRLPVDEIPDITDRLVIAPNQDPQGVLAALGLAAVTDD